VQYPRWLLKFGSIIVARLTPLCLAEPIGELFFPPSFFDSSSETRSLLLSRCLNSLGNPLVNGMGNIALQRVKGNPAMGSGAMNGIT
jgi:hypothetical protein